MQCSGGNYRLIVGAQLKRVSWAARKGNTGEGTPKKVMLESLPESRKSGNG